MIRYEYRVLPAPHRGVKTRGAKTTEARFAHALMQIMNELGRDGWEYQRTDTLPCEERVGLTGRTTRFQNMLVFRRALAAAGEKRAIAEFIRAALPPPEAPAETAAVAAAEAADRAAEPQVAASGGVARRLAATLSARAREGLTPRLHKVDAAAGAPPKLGAAGGTGPDRPGNGSDVAAE